MGTMLTALAALLIVIGLIVIGIRISLYLFLQHAYRTRHFMPGMPFADERVRSDTLYTVRRPGYHRAVMNTGHSNARYALHSFMAIALLLLLTIVAGVFVLLGSVH
jgi:hypothetical protein